SPTCWVTRATGAMTLASRRRRSRDSARASCSRSRSPALAPLLALAQLDAPDLAAHGLRQLGDELDLARILVRRGHALHMLLARAHQLVARGVARLEHDEGLHHLAAHGVGAGDHGRLDHRVMLEQRALDLERADPVAGGDDHVVGAPDEPEIPVLVARRPI